MHTFHVHSKKAARTHRSICVSEWCELKTGCAMKPVDRRSSCVCFLGSVLRFCFRYICVVVTAHLSIHPIHPSPHTHTHRRQRRRRPRRHAPNIDALHTERPQQGLDILLGDTLPEGEPHGVGVDHAHVQAAGGRRLLDGLGGLACVVV